MFCLCNGNYPAVKRREARLQAPTRINFKDVMLSGRSQSQEASFLCLEGISRIGKPTEAERNLVGAQSWGPMESNCLMGTEFVLVMVKIFWKTEVLVVQHCECTKYHGAVYVKMVNIVLCGFQLN